MFDTNAPFGVGRFGSLEIDCMDDHSGTTSQPTKDEPQSSEDNDDDDKNTENAVAAATAAVARWQADALLRFLCIAVGV